MLKGTQYKMFTYKRENFCIYICICVLSVFVSLVESHFSLLIVKSLSGNQSGVAAPAGLLTISSCVTAQSQHLQIRPRSQSSKHMFQI